MRQGQLLVPVMAVVVCGGCGASAFPTNGMTSGQSSETPCDPLAAAPITPGTIVGVGKDADGTLYLDAANGVFVSAAGGPLIRQHVLGTGQSGANEFIFTFESRAEDGGSSERDLLVETTGGAATAMALGPGGARMFLNQSVAGATTLTVVDPATVAGLAVVNTPSVISYVGDVANGDVVLATVPLNADPPPASGGLSDGGLRIFYGPPENVAERVITAFGESLSGNGAVTFLVGNTSYSLDFGMVQAADAGPLGAFTLEGLTPQGGTTSAVTLRSPKPTTPPAALAFSCLAGA
ncbi:MAG TPA: hypothetical protein VLA79_07300 [Polyangia bacterium]|nr:hypothetical protein [Polyangia bacterium]